MAIPDLCGTEALQAVISYWGKRADFSQESGVLKAANSVGFVGFYDKADIEALCRHLDSGLPVIVDLVEDERYSVIVGMDNDHMYAVDSETKPRYAKIPVDIFNENFEARRLIIITPEKTVQ
jgi:hypothetical protein